MSFDKESVLHLLQASDPVSITFVKLDGTFRDMVATTNTEVIRDLGVDIPGEKSDYSEDQIRVVDVELKEWRSFIFENLVTVDGLAPLE